jgi:tRNA-Thr(GGU) m(6)t(6)A37 methyltransferase TsaA
MKKPLDSINLKPLAWLRADFQQKFCTPRQGSLAKHSRAFVELAKDWRGRGIFTGLESFSHVWLVSYLHLSTNNRTRGKIHPPRLKGAKVGVLGSRSPHRPNNIGLTLARIEKCEGDELHLSEVDLVDGTPILDIKPYVALADRPDVYTSGWASEIAEPDRVCDFSEEALADLKQVSKNPERIQALINEMLTQDPRPPAYVKKGDAEFFVWVAGLNVKFRFHQEKFTVVGVEQAES